jgi:hypothetical protein
MSMPLPQAFGEGDQQLQPELMDFIVQYPESNVNNLMMFRMAYPIHASRQVRIAGDHSTGPVFVGRGVCGAVESGTAVSLAIGRALRVDAEGRG